MNEWAEYWEIEPWGAWRDNFHTAMLASLIARANGAKDVSVKDFMYQPRARAEDPSTLSSAAGLFSWLRARVKKKPKRSKA